MATVEESIEVDVPVSTAYNQWTQFEEFPQFMEGVEEVRQLDDTHLHWVAQGRRQAEASGTRRSPSSIRTSGWRGSPRTGKTNAGVVTFHRLDDNACKVMVQIEWEPEGILESLGASLEATTGAVRGDLERFKEHLLPEELVGPSLDVQAQERLRVGRPHVAPPVIELYRQAVEAVLLPVLQRFGDPLDRGVRSSPGC